MRKIKEISSKSQVSVENFSGRPYYKTLSLSRLAAESCGHWTGWSVATQKRPLRQPAIAHPKAPKTWSVCFQPRTGSFPKHFPLPTRAHLVFSSSQPSHPSTTRLPKYCKVSNNNNTIVSQTFLPLPYTCCRYRANHFAQHTINFDHIPTTTATTPSSCDNYHQAG